MDQRTRRGGGAGVVGIGSQYDRIVRPGRLDERSLPQPLWKTAILSIANSSSHYPRPVLMLHHRDPKALPGKQSKKAIEKCSGSLLANLRVTNFVR